jgi:tetratricopeptide (TPR) repeat protein
MKTSVVLIALFLATTCCAGQTEELSDWPRLLSSKKVEDAKALCERYASSKTLSERVEAQKCLANVALCGNNQIMLEGDDAGGGNLRGSYKPEAVDEALKHLDLGIQLAPQDLSIHQGRLHILEASGRYGDMIKALDDSAGIYKGNDALEAWLAYSAELADLRQYQAGFDAMKVIERYFPNSPDVIANLGAFLTLLGRTKESIPYLEKAAQLAPQDPINAWDLGRAYDYDGQITLADTWYKKGIAIDSDAERVKRSRCLYAVFVEKKLKDRARACTLQKQDCEADEQTACAPNPADAQKL